MHGLQGSKGLYGIGVAHDLRAALRAARSQGFQGPNGLQGSHGPQGSHGLQHPPGTQRPNEPHGKFEKQEPLALEREALHGAQGWQGPPQPHEPKGLLDFPALHRPQGPQDGKQPNRAEEPKGLNDSGPRIPHGPQLNPLPGNLHGPTDEQRLLAPQNPFVLHGSQTLNDPRDACEVKGSQGWQVLHDGLYSYDPHFT